MSVVESVAVQWAVKELGPRAKEGGSARKRKSAGFESQPTPAEHAQCRSKSPCSGQVLAFKSPKS